MQLPSPETAFRPAPRRDAFLFDLDGTLLEIAAHPDDVVVPAGLPDALARLRDAADGAVAVVSGRAVSMLERVLGPLRLPLAGLHGLELKLDPEGDGLAVAPPAAAAGLEALRRLLPDWRRDRPGLYIEDKGLAVALHFRDRPELGPAVERFADDFTADPTLGLHAQRGKMVVEIKPGGRTKGDAVAAIMALPAFAGRRPLYFGDDVTDEDAFAAAEALGGGGVVVGPLQRETRARARLDGPADVMRLIDAVAAGLHGGPAEGAAPSWR